jgi:hypothetical protein
VEINSKKIEYFEYTDMSSRSEKVEDAENQSYPQATYEHAKAFHLKRKLQQRVLNDQRLLQRKKEQNLQRAARSAKLVSNHDTPLRLCQGLSSPHY